MIELNFSNFLTFLSLLFSLFFFIHISFPLKNSQTYLSFYYTKSTQTFLTSINNNLPRFCLPRYISMIVQRTTPSSIRNVNILATYVSRRINLQSINTLLYNNILRFDSTRIFLSRVNINNNLFSSPIITCSRNNKSTNHEFHRREMEMANKPSAAIFPGGRKKNSNGFTERLLPLFDLRSRRRPWCTPVEGCTYVTTSFAMERRGEA